MTTTTLFALLLLFAAAHARASDSSSLASVGSETVEASSTTNSSSSSSSSEATLAPIDTASSTSTTFQLVDNVVCNATVSSKIYVIYNKNRALFDACVSDAQYQVFPFLGTQPSATQVEGIATSTNCIAVLTGVELAGFPQCTISGFPLKAAVETILKIHVDIVYELAASPTAARFQEMMTWRKNVNLAKDTGVPYDEESELYQEYEENLGVALGNSSIRVLSDYTVQYQLSSGSWVGGEEDDLVVGSSSTDNDDDAGTVSAGDGDSKVSDSAAGNVAQNSSATTGSSASTVATPTVVTAAVSILLSALLMAS